MDAKKRMTDLINVTGRLIDVLERENVLLRERRHGELNLLLDEKETIARVYQARVMGLQENPDQLQDAEEGDRAQLKELAHRVDELMNENARMLEAAMHASKRIVELVAEAIRDTSNPSGTYSQKGSTSVSPNKGGARNSAISLDQTL